MSLATALANYQEPLVNTLNGKLGPAEVWLLAVITLAVALAVTRLSPSITGPISPRAMAALHFALFGLGASICTSWLGGAPAHLD